MELKAISLRRAEKYGVTLSDLIEWASDCEYTYSHVHHNAAISKYWPARDTIIVTDADGNTAGVEIIEGHCPVCGELCVAWGWCDGGVHESTCRCTVIDTGP